MRTLVIGDIHGAYYPLLQVMERAKVTPDDQLIFLGDYADRGAHTPRYSTTSSPYKIPIG